jgi:hypothetical protein
LAKVEKVVKPPHKPVVRSRHQGWEVELYRPNKAYSNPMTKHPKRLTISVPHGKPCVQIFFIQVEMRYLNAPPMKLPMPTIHSDFIIFLFFIIPIDGTKIGKISLPLAYFNKDWHIWVSVGLR